MLVSRQILRRASPILRMTSRRGVLLLSRAGGFLLGGAGNDAENFFFAHDDEVFAIELDLGASVLAEQYAIAFFHSEREDLAVFVDFAFASGDDFAFLRFVFGGVRDDDATTGGLGLFDAADQDAVMQRGKFRHVGRNSFRGISDWEFRGGLQGTKRAASTPT